MSTFLSFLFFAVIIAFILGLIKPKAVIRWGIDEKKTRKNVLKSYGLGTVIVFVLFGFVNSAEQTQIANKAAATKADTAISALEPVSSLTTDKIKTYDDAQAAYDNLTEQQKALVTKATVLTEAKTVIEKYKAAEVDNMMASLGVPSDLTLDSSTKVGEARTAYDSLTDTEKGLITKLNVLTAAENKLYLISKANEEKAAAEAAAEAKAREAAYQAQKEADAAAAKAKAKTEGVDIGMTKQQVLDSMWGEPDKINTTTNAYGTHEQWVYRSKWSGYLYFDDGILTSIQN